MKVERTSADGLTHERWTFGLDHMADGYAWRCSEYVRKTRKNKRAKSWTVTAYFGRWPQYAGAQIATLREAPIDDALAAEVRRVATEAAVVSLREELKL